MFGFLKQKLKDAVSVFSKKVDEESKEIESKEIEVSEKQTQPDSKPELKITEEEKASVKAVETLKEEIKKDKKDGIEQPKKEDLEQPENKDTEQQKNKDTEQQKKEQQPKEIKTIEEVADIKSEPSEPVKGIKENLVLETPATDKVEEIVEKLELITPEKKSFFSKIKEKIVSKRLTQEKFEDLFWELELVLLENNVAVEVIDKIKEDLKQNLVDKPIKRNQIQEIILETLKLSINDLFNIEPINLIKNIKDSDKPYIICFFGINGSGKTTSIAKLGYYLQKQGISTVLAASDTFRAAAIDQLEEHANNLAIKLIKHDYGSDSAAVAFDAVKYAKAHKLDVVLIDTAGRMHSNTNLMEELKKIVKVVKPNLSVFVGESITGNDCVEQAKIYDKEIGIQGIILTKADIDDKGGAPISISYVTKKPILFLGMGQQYDDLKPFDKTEILTKLF